jgi:hypothetical protein
VGINISEEDAASIFMVELSRVIMWKGGINHAKQHKIGQLDLHDMLRRCSPDGIMGCD